MTKIAVTYIDHMGSDLSVVNAARVSFGKKSEWVWEEFGKKIYFRNSYARLSDRDTKLIHYLAKHKHLSPFGHAFASFHVKAPIFVARQLVKHKFLRWNEISRRYVDEEPEFYVPDVWRGRSADKKQGSEGEVKTNVNIDYHNKVALAVYIQKIDEGVAPEQARMVLPQSTMTEWYWSGSLDAFAAMCKLRCASDTQYESRIVADQISEQMKELFPVSWEALMELETKQPFSEYGNYGENNPPLGASNE
jgi:thymidylate synthase (FAD)